MFPRTLLFQLGYFLLFVLASFSYCPTQASTQSLSSIKNGHIHPLLHHQALSHFSLHSFGVQQKLAALFEPRAIAIVGVEWGTEVRHFAQQKYHVYAVEPADTFVRHLNNVQEQNPTWNLTVFPFAAGNTSNSTVHFAYDNANVAQQVPMHRLDDVIFESLAVLSADVQGDELAVLQGTSRLLHRIHSIWVEAIACNPQNIQLLNLLDVNFTIFDFVPWGLPNSGNYNTVPNDRQSFAYNPERPSSFSDYLSWMCDSRTSSFKWLQTDFLAIQTALVEKVWDQLSALASSACDSADSNCLLRQVLHHDTLEERKEDL